MDAVYERARAVGAEIVYYPVTDEDWGLRRFFVCDPNGVVINVTQHDEYQVARRGRCSGMTPGP